jgi:SAM-dependent methyltransferase
MRDRPAFDLFLISWLVLFLELACIRWFPSHVLFLTFFTNTVLLASFVGMSVGCLVARRPTRFLRQTPYLLAVALTTGLAVDLSSGTLQRIFDVGNQANPDVVYFGTESITENPLGFTIPIEVVGGLFFVLIAITLVGPGQEMGRAFNRVENRTTAYSANLLGSLVGIGMFAACSYLQLAPVVWFGAIALVIAYLLLRNDPNAPVMPAAPSGPYDLGEQNQPVQPSQFMPILVLIASLAVTVFTSGFFDAKGFQTAWSPYYRIDYEAKTRTIATNQISHQSMFPIDTPAVAPYSLPYLFQRDLKAKDGQPAWQPFKRVLIIGAGSGNDVARALQWIPKDAKVDAVEIDPVIQRIGKYNHPDKPFADDRVTVYLNDGRNFLREAPAETYDLVVFALIDSLVLQSGYSTLRLESYLFTLQSFQDVRRVLKPTGVYTVYNFFRQGWIAGRIRDQLRTAFNDSEPVTFTSSLSDWPKAEIRAEDSDPNGFTVFFAGSPAVLDPLRQAFRPEGMRYWYPWRTGVPKDSAAQFSVTAPATLPPESKHPWMDREKKPYPPLWYPLRIADVKPMEGLRLATDDWPFLYARQPSIPGLTWRGVVLTLVLSIVIWFAFGGRKSLSSESGATPEWGLMLRCFLLGAGFMLVETKAVVQMALLFGGTWMVNTVVFAAILVMSLLGNLYAGKVNPKRLEPYYIGLFGALALGLAISPSVFLGLNPTLQIVGVCALVFAPIAFAGVIFATSFKRTSQPDRVFGANVAGALVGGLAENTSVLLGFQLLLCVAIGFYLLSAAFGNRQVPIGAAEKSV